MGNVCFYFQVHQPYRLRRDYGFFDIGRRHDYEDVPLNRQLLEEIAAKCYRPANRLWLEVIEATGGEVRLAFSCSGLLLEQLAAWAPHVLESFQELVATGNVEIIGETYYHSLAALFSPAELRAQAELHRAACQEYFGVVPTCFRNTELIYNNEVAAAAAELGYTTVLAEGADRLLDGRTPNRVYRPPDLPDMRLLTKNYKLSDDLAFRFSDPDWDQRPLTADKYADWLHAAADRGHTVNLFLDYETFGEHHWAATGIFLFLRRLPEELLARKVGFRTPSEVAAAARDPEVLDCPEFVSWADHERDLSAWQGNAMQKAAAESLYALEDAIHSVADDHILKLWRRLQCSDHFYYMSTKGFSDGAVHEYFNPYGSPHDAFVVYMNVLNDLRGRLGL